MDTLYRQKSDTFIRHFEEIGYIVNEGLLSDRVVDAAGAAFLDPLSREPKPLSLLAAEVSKAFRNPPENIGQDVRAFYDALTADGFLVSGETPEALDAGERAQRTSPGPRMAHGGILRAGQDSQSYLNSYFERHPHLLSMQLELTSKCNERCVHCYIPHKDKNEDMPYSLFDDVVSQASEMGLLSMTLSGGEPLSHPQFCKMLERIQKCDFSVRILSNLTLLDDEILAELLRTRIASVKVSLYSMRPETHDSITQLPGSHAKTMRAIDRLLESGVPLMINCPTMKENRNDLADVLSFGAERGIRTVTDYVMMARYDRSSDNLEHRLSLAEIEPLIRDVIEKDLDYSDRLLRTDLRKEREKDVSGEPVCGVCVSSISMVPNGNLYPCAGWQSRILGNVREQSLRDVWENSEEVLYLRRLRRRDFPKCLECADRPFCAMCMVRNANENPAGDPLVVNPHFCEVAALNRRVAEEWLAGHGKAGD